MYLTTATRPDIAFSIGQCARFMANPGVDHFRALDRIWKYLIGTPNTGVSYGQSRDLKIQGYCDSDWGGDYPTRKSTTGYLFTLNGGAISWNSRLQKTVALSSCEAEYMALKEAIKEQIWFKALFEQIPGLSRIYDTTLFTDSQSAIALAKNPEHHARTKHVDIQYHFVRQKATEEKLVDLRYISTNNQLADGLTKGLDSVKHRYFTTGIGLA